MHRAIGITTGIHFLGEEDLLLMRLPDGALGALRRGQVFPLKSENSIDVGGEFSVPGVCRPYEEPSAPTPPPAAWTLTQEDPPILLIRGTETIRDHLLASIEAAGGRISALGPCLALNDEQSTIADWFAIPSGISREAVEASLRTQVATKLPIHKSTEELLAAALDQAFFLHKALEHFRGKVTDATETISKMADRLQATESAWVEEASAREAAEQLAQAVKNAAPMPPAGNTTVPSSTRRMIVELSIYLEMLLPKLSFTRGSAEFLVLSVTNRGPILRILRSLQDSPDDLRHWKTIKGVASWQERHFSNGQDNTGRIYARLRRDSLIDVLLSMKGTQDRDIAWLQSQ